MPKQPTISENRIVDTLANYQVKWLYYLAPLANTPPILASGIFSYNEMNRIGIPHSNISLDSVQRRRQAIVPGTVHSIHHYVPLYFATHTPMQRIVTIGTRSRRPILGQDEICILQINALKVFRHPGVLFTDGNAASDASSFYLDIEELGKLDWKIINTLNCYSEEYKRKKSAEVLVPKWVSHEYIDCGYVYSDEAGEKLVGQINKLYLELRKHSPQQNFNHMKKCPLWIGSSHFYGDRW